MNVLVTGGAGYIGSHTCRQLSIHGITPVTFDSLVSGRAEAVRWGPFVRGDLRESEALVAAIRAHRVAMVLHFAAPALVGQSIQQPELYYETNLSGTLSLLRAMRITGVRQLVFSSTAAIYGVPHTLPIAESHPQRPVSPYGASKMMVERVLEDYAAASPLASVALRYFNAAGADPDGELGEDHEPETHLIPLAIDAARHRGPPLMVHGGDYPTADGTCVRDYIHVTDLALAHLAALRHLEAGAAGALAYNLGNGRGFSVYEVLETVAQVTGQAVPHRLGPRRAGDPAVLVADSRRAQLELGWRPRHASLDEIVATAWRWQRGKRRRVPRAQRHRRLLGPAGPRPAGGGCR